jgi:hypothetical protein
MVVVVVVVDVVVAVLISEVVDEECIITILLPFLRLPLEEEEEVGVDGGDFLPIPLPMVDHLPVRILPTTRQPHHELIRGIEITPIPINFKIGQTTIIAATTITTSINNNMFLPQMMHLLLLLPTDLLIVVGINFIQLTITITTATAAVVHVIWIL